MAFTKKTWVARQGTGLNKFSIDGATPVTVVNQPDSVTEQGDALSAENLNNLENRIAEAFDETASQEEVTDLKNACEEITGCEILEITAKKKYIDLSGSSVTMSDGVPQITGDSSSWNLTLVQCSAGDVFTISGTGGVSTRLWGFVSSDGTILEKANASVTETELVKTAPTSSAWLIIHDNTGKTSYSGELTKIKLDALQSDISDSINRIITISANLINPSEKVVGYLIDGGSVVTDNGYSTTGFIKIKTGKYVKKMATGSDENLGASAKAIFAYDKNKTFLYQINGTKLESNWYSYNITDENVAYIRLSTYLSSISAPACYFGLGESVLQDIPKYGFVINSDGTIDYSQITNAINPNDLLKIDGKVDRIATISSNMVDPSLKEVGYLNVSNGNVIADSGYATTGFIPITTGKYVKKILASGMGLGAPKLCLYRADKSFYDTIDGTLLETNWYKYNITNSNVAYARFSTYLTSISAPTCYFGKGESVLSTVPKYGFVINSDGTIDYSQITNAPQSLAYDYKCSLTGKKWYALGDSATHGDGATTLTEGMYAGQLAVYPFYIGNRTGADVHNLAVNGGVIATITDQPSRYQLSKDGNYDAVPSDADIITIWFGANDMWQSVPIGTIDSNDATTFYGAWNKVLSYYVNNYPNTKLGIVASFWCTQAYAEAVIAIGAKYGVPVLNLYNDPKIPVTVGSQRPDVSASVKSTRNTQWIVGNGNTHPSSAYHEIESYFIEEWLKTL